MNKHAMGMITGCLCLAMLHMSSALAADREAFFPGNKEKHLREAAKYRFESNNDAIFGSDNQFSNGWAFQIHTPVADRWSAVEGPPDYINKIGAWLPTLTADNHKYRASLSIGQIIQTPDDIKNPNLITDDVPYAGVLTVKSSWIAFNETDFRGAELIVGVLGRPSMAEQTQNLVHKTFDSNIAQGWDNQLKTEPVINANYMRKKKFYQAGNLAKFSFDAAISGDVQLGTLFTSAGARLETRFGWNMPRGFMYVPDPIGRFLTYDATLAPLNPNKSSIYGTISLGGSYSAHNLLFDGNVFRDVVQSVEKEDVLGYVTIGAHFERPSWALHFDINLTTDTVDTSKVTGNPDTDNSFATLAFEWRI